MQRPTPSCQISLIEDETGVANLIPWKDRFERQRQLVLSAGMIACHGRVQRESEVIHVVTDHLEDLSDLLRSVGEHDEPQLRQGDNQLGRAARSLYFERLRLRG